MSIRRIEALAQKFRYATDAAFKWGVFGQEQPFDRFPHACCNDMCDLFGQYLIDEGISISKVYGVYRYDGSAENVYSHVWLQIDGGTIIDLTGDQYKHDPIMLNYNAPCYVGPPSPLHHLFDDDIQVRPYWGLDNYDDGPRKRLRRLYKNIMSFYCEL